MISEVIFEADFELRFGSPGHWLAKVLGGPSLANVINFVAHDVPGGGNSKYFGGVTLDARDWPFFGSPGLAAKKRRPQRNALRSSGRRE